MSDPNIVDEPLQQDLNDRTNAEKVYSCEGCGDTFPTGIAKATHCRSCDEYKTWKAEQGEPTPSERDDVAPEDDDVYRGEGDSNEILRQILTDFPGVSKAVVTEVMSWAELWGTIPPYYLPYLLGQMKGVAMGTANLITQKYTLALQKTQQYQNMMRQQGPMGGPPMGMGMTGMGAPGGMGMPPTMGGFPGFQRQPQPWGPYGQGGYAQGYPGQYPPRIPPGGVTKADLENLKKSMEEKSEMQQLRDIVGDLTKSVGSLKGDIIREVGDSRTRYREIRVPIDKDGNPCSPQEAVSVRYERVPMEGGQSGPGLSSALLARLDNLDKKINDQTLGKIQSDLEDLKRDGGGGGRSKEIDKLVTQLERQEELIGSLSGQIETNKYNALLEELGRIKTQMGRAGSGEWDSDEMKMLSKGLDRLADVFENKKPVEVLKEALFPTLQVSPLTPEMEQPLTSTPPTLVEMMRDKGLVATLRRGGG